ncbi:MAG: GIY-YIG nuclease family protein [Ignavibacteriales bacterium]|nr:GIY-YIG nuclease family protein [Ignavibacteriales bacterium]
MNHSRLKTVLGSFPDTPGVYLFFGTGDLLLYVGKSRTLRSRIRSHFFSRDERRLRRKVRRIEVRETAGELGALLLESKLIKDLRPLYNVAARQRRRIVLARKSETRLGYVGVELEAVDSLKPDDAFRVLGVFKHTTQAKEFLAGISKGYRLCPKLLGLERSRGRCFSSHLGRCNGACVGDEAPTTYNARLEAAFEERRVKAWPYEGSVLVEEQSADRGLNESFLIDNWCLLASTRTTGNDVQEHAHQSHRFDYDSYKILYSFLTDPVNQLLIRTVERAGENKV